MLSSRPDKVDRLDTARRCVRILAVVSAAAAVGIAADSWLRAEVPSSTLRPLVRALGVVGPALTPTGRQRRHPEVGLPGVVVHHSPGLGQGGYAPVDLLLDRPGHLGRIHQ
jgi:hypothetical protein